MHQTTFKLAVVSLFFTLGLLTVSPDNAHANVPHVTSILVTDSYGQTATTTLQVGSALQLLSTTTPANVIDPSVTWVSSNSGVISVDGAGLVTAISVGATTITATANDTTNGTATSTYSVTSVAAFSSDVYVDKSYGGAPDGSVAHPLTTIQAGIDATLSGGTTHVAAGTYSECLIIGKGVTVTGANAATTIIDTAPCGGDSDGVRITTNNVNFNNFTIKKSNGFDGLYSISVGTDGAISGLILDHLIMSEGDRRRGISVSNTSGQLTNSNIQRFCSGVWIENSTNFTVDGNTISNNGVRNECIPTTGGVDVMNSNLITIRNNTIGSNDVGVYVNGSSNVDIYANKISGNYGYNDSFGYGINNFNEGNIVNARMNWWGNVSGPSHSSNDGGNGDAVSNGVAFSPWFGDIELESVRGIPSVDDDTTKYFTITENVNATSTDGYVLNIKAGATFTGSSTWDGSIDPPTVTTISTAPSRSGYTTTMGSIIEVGFSGSKLSLSNAARLFFPGEAGRLIGWTRPGEGFTEITAVCTEDSQSWADGEGGLLTDGDCKKDVGGGLVVWTRHFTTFGTYTQTVTPAPSSGGSPGSIGIFPSTTGTGGPSVTAGPTAPSASVGTVLGASVFVFLKNLGFGSRGNDVIELHKILIKEGLLKISTPTGWFGPLTKAALMKYQAKNKLPATGYFGHITREFINKLNAI
ncbi:MAG: Ig-like domain-containing protein [Minisyncoccia bacterium]